MSLALRSITYTRSIREAKLGEVQSILTGLFPESDTHYQIVVAIAVSMTVHAAVH
jgi:hypothetical protein